MDKPQPTLWDLYANSTDATAAYPDAGLKTPLGLAYITLGLIGEIGELQAYRISAAPADKKALAELGDCFWYLGRFHREFGPLELPNVWMSGDVSLAYILRLQGALANAAKKVLRDGAPPDKTMRVAQTIFSELLLVACHAAQTRTWEGLDQAILAPNQEKLRSRLARGVIAGDGDSR